MILMDDISSLLPNPRSGKIVGIASHRGDYIVVACEYGLYLLWDDGTGHPDLKAERVADSASAEPK